MVRVKQAKLRDYIPFKGSDGEESSEVEDEHSLAKSNQGSQDQNDEVMMDSEEISY